VTSKEQVFLPGERSLRRGISAGGRSFSKKKKLSPTRKIDFMKNMIKFSYGNF
jgi:hypothetical protein